MKNSAFGIRLALVLAVLAFIWINSMLSGDISQYESDKVLEVVEPVVEPVQQQLEDMGYHVCKRNLVRKMAHFAEYTVLGAATLLLFTTPDGRSRYLMPMLLCFGAACVDEGIQIFAVNRGPQFKDVLLDFSGACCGILGMALVVLIVCALRRRRV